MNAMEKTDWSIDDRELEAEFRDVSSVLRDLESTNAGPPSVPRSLDRRIRQLAGDAFPTNILGHWIFGSGPLVILVTLILFAVAMFVLIL